MQFGASGAVCRGRNWAFHQRPEIKRQLLMPFFRSIKVKTCVCEYLLRSGITYLLSFGLVVPFRKKCTQFGHLLCMFFHEPKPPGRALFGRHGNRATSPKRVRACFGMSVPVCYFDIGNQPRPRHLGQSFCLKPPCMGTWPDPSHCGQPRFSTARTCFVSRVSLLTWAWTITNPCSAIRRR
jgi:hypothetical protein